MEAWDIIAAAPIILAAVALVKMPVEHYTNLNLGPLAPLISVVAGLVGVALGWIDGGAQAGFLAGLSASGLYSAGKATVAEPVQDYQHRKAVADNLRDNG